MHSGLKDAVVIVTGASRGIGKALALEFAKEGAAVVIGARSETEGALPGTIYQTAKEIEALGGMALPARADISKEEDVAALIDMTLKAFGTIDVLINNAAVAVFAELKDTLLRHFDLMVKVNLRGSILCMQAVLPTMIAKGGGSIINLSSRAADLITTPAGSGVEKTTGVVYGATKIALERCTRGLAAEVKGYNIAVNAIKPSATIETEGLRINLPEADRSQWVSPQQYMTKAIVFLARQRGRDGLTGQVVKDRELCEKYGL